MHTNGFGRLYTLFSIVQRMKWKVVRSVKPAQSTNIRRAYSVRSYENFKHSGNSIHVSSINSAQLPFTTQTETGVEWGEGAVGGGDRQISKYTRKKPSHKFQTIYIYSTLTKSRKTPADRHEGRKTNNSVKNGTQQPGEGETG